MTRLARLIGLLVDGRQFIILLLVGGMAAFGYVHWRSAAADRDGLMHWADQTCEAAGRSFRPEGASMGNWGGACLSEVRRLAKVEEDLKQGSLDSLLQDLERREGKTATDAALAAVMAKRAADAAERMERVNGAVENDIVGGSWACAVNELGGLRSPDC